MIDPDDPELLDAGTESEEDGQSAAGGSASEEGLLEEVSSSVHGDGTLVLTAKLGSLTISATYFY